MLGLVCVLIILYFLFSATTVSNLLSNVTLSNETRELGNIEAGFRELTAKLHLFLTPVIVIVGIISNMLSVLVFTTTHLRLQSSSVYLTSLAISDSGYLLALFIAWFGWIDIHLFHRNFWCQAVVYVTYVCSCISVWNVASFTIERYIVVCHPFKRVMLCNVRSSLIVVSSEAIFALLFYGFSLYTSRVGPDNMCTTPIELLSFVEMMVYIDTVITLIIPSLIIVLLNIKLFFTVYRLLRQPETTCTELSQPGAMSTVAGSSSGSSRYSNSSHKWTGGCFGVQRGPLSTSASEAQSGGSTRYKPCPQVRTTRMLLIVSTVFVLLMLPSHAFRIHAFVAALVAPDYHPTASVLRCQELLHFLYYMNFAMTFFLYTGSRKAFRIALCRMLNRYQYNIRRFFRTMLYKCCTVCEKCSLRKSESAHSQPHMVVLEEHGAYVYVSNVKHSRHSKRKQNPFF